MAERTEGEARDVLPTDLVIRVNVTLTNDPCALCGEPTDPTGIDLYLAERPALVCHACGFLHAPALVRLLDLASAANTFVRAEYEMSGVQSDEKHT
jgi:recombinational DNA repair protein (RecF pathway)